MNKLARQLVSPFTTEEAANYAKWYDLIWLLIPIAGVAFFVLVVQSRYWNAGGK